MFIFKTRNRTKKPELPHINKDMKIESGFLVPLFSSRPKSQRFSATSLNKARRKGQQSALIPQRQHTSCQTVLKPATTADAGDDSEDTKQGKYYGK